ncbi:hypothetical protein PGTUg99_034445 [Puccinia graminis f. sp. tritici]|uniref:Uncharacterized protein n=1 Tax=Puccinia graminis f. sp. tritici TaxID=56615 RepID=A0A5B0QUR3_PUCGR|nr:hypothetical protein PGTUg99_034445 [Puccinia graminis f. sp. tritici]
MVIRAFSFFGSRKIGAGLNQISRDNRPVSQSGARCAPKSRRLGRHQPIMAHQSAPSMKWLSFIHHCTLPASWAVTELPHRYIKPSLENLLRQFPSSSLIPASKQLLTCPLNLQITHHNHNQSKALHFVTHPRKLSALPIDSEISASKPEK